MSRCRQIALVAAGAGALYLAISGARARIEAPRETRVPTARLVHAAGGPIADLVLQFHRTEPDRFLPVFVAILAELDPSTQVHVAVADAADRTLFEAALRRAPAAARRPPIRYLEVGPPITSWSRDRFADLSDERGVVILAPPAPATGPETRVHDWLVPWALRRHLGGTTRIRTAPFRFEGGDLVADEARVYLSPLLARRNPDLGHAQLFARVERATGLRAVRVDTDARPGPEHHVGMFVTPLGGGRVAVADPALGVAALGAAVRPDANGVATIDVGGAPLAVDLRPETHDRFRVVADRLRAEGLRVVPIPLLPGLEPFVYLGYDNVLLERRADGRLHGLVPEYGVPALDSAAHRAWRDAGVVVHPIPVASVFRLGGTVRCLAATVRRR